MATRLRLTMLVVVMGTFLGLGRIAMRGGPARVPAAQAQGSSGLVACPCVPPSSQRVEWCGAVICRTDGGSTDYTVSGNYVLQPIGGGPEQQVSFSLTTQEGAGACLFPSYTSQPASCPTQLEMVRIDWQSNVSAEQVATANACQDTSIGPPPAHYFWDYSAPISASCSLGQPPSSVHQFRVKLIVDLAVAQHVADALGLRCPASPGNGTAMSMSCWRGAHAAGNGGQGVACGQFTWGPPGPNNSPVVAKVGAREYDMRGWREPSRDGDVFHFVIDGYDPVHGGTAVDSFRAARAVTDAQGNQHCLKSGPGGCEDPTYTVFCEPLGVFSLWVRPKVPGQFGQSLRWREWPNRACGGDRMGQYAVNPEFWYGDAGELAEAGVSDCGDVSATHPWLARYSCLALYGDNCGFSVFADYAHKFIMVLDSPIYGRPCVTGVAQDGHACSTRIQKVSAAECASGYNCHPEGFSGASCKAEGVTLCYPNGDDEDSVYMQAIVTSYCP